MPSFGHRWSAWICCLTWCITRHQVLIYTNIYKHSTQGGHATHWCGLCCWRGSSRAWCERLWQHQVSPNIITLQKMGTLLAGQGVCDKITSIRISVTALSLSTSQKICKLLRRGSKAWCGRLWTNQIKSNINNLITYPAHTHTHTLTA